MLTQQDLKAIGQLIDKKVATDLSAIQARLADLESGQIQRIDYLELRQLMKNLEKRMAAVEGRLTKVDERLYETLTKDDLTKALRGIARKKDVNALDRKLVKKLNLIIGYLDREILETQEKLNTLEQRIAVPTVS